MNSSKQKVTVRRAYRVAYDDCGRALEILLKPTVRKEGGCGTAPKDALKGSKHDRAKAILHD